MCPKAKPIPSRPKRPIISNKTHCTCRMHVIAFPGQPRLGIVACVVYDMRATQRIYKEHVPLVPVCSCRSMRSPPRAHTHTHPRYVVRLLNWCGARSAKDLCGLNRHAAAAPTPRYERGWPLRRHGLATNVLGRSQHHGVACSRRLAPLPLPTFRILRSVARPPCASLMELLRAARHPARIDRVSAGSARF